MIYYAASILYNKGEGSWLGRDQLVLIILGLGLGTEYYTKVYTN